MRSFFDRLHARLLGALSLLLLFTLSFFIGGLGCRFSRRSPREESALSPFLESEVIHAFLWTNEEN